MADSEMDTGVKASVKGAWSRGYFAEVTPCGTSPSDKLAVIGHEGHEEVWIIVQEDGGPESTVMLSPEHALTVAAQITEAAQRVKR